MHNHASNVNETREQPQDVDGLSLPEPLLESGQNRIQDPSEVEHPDMGQWQILPGWLPRWVNAALYLQLTQTTTNTSKKEITMILKHMTCP